MNAYEFDLIFMLPPEAPDSEAHLDNLFEAGCDDATVGMGRQGEIALAFIREAESADAAVSSAINDVEKAIFGARLIRVKPDLVGPTDVAGLADCSRQNIRHLVEKHSSEVVPVYAGSATLWHLFEIGRLLNQHSSFRIPQALLDVSRVAWRRNTLLEFMRRRQLA